MNPQFIVILDYPGTNLHRWIVVVVVLDRVGHQVDRGLVQTVGVARTGSPELRKPDGVTLSGGEQQMLAVARALARDIKLLLLDEPYEGLAPVIVHEIEKLVEEIKGLGITTVIVEQNAVAALTLADRAVILEMGQVVFEGGASDVLENAELRHQYLAI